MLRAQGGEDDVDEAVHEAEILLGDFDTEYRAAAASEGARGRGGAKTANQWASTVPREPLAAAVRALRAATPPTGPAVLLGFCASDAEAGVAALRDWVRELDLPRGLVYNMDEDGEPIDLSGFGPVFIKYNSGTGSARLSRCPGQFRGVYFTPDLGDGVFRQYGALPLGLFARDPAHELALMRSQLAVAKTLRTANESARNAAAHFAALAAAPDAVLAAVDVEAWEMDKSRVTEVGVAIFSKGALRHRHFLVAEHLAMRNGRFCDDNRDHFLFGTSETMPLGAVADAVSEELRSADFFIGHDVRNDVAWLRDIGCEISPQLEQNVLDTQGLARARGLGQKLSLKDLAKLFGLMPERLHNGGNDAAFTLQVLLSLAARDGWEPPLRRRSAHWQKPHFRSFEASARRKFARRCSAGGGYDI